MKNMFKKYIILFSLSMLVSSDFKNLRLLEFTSKTELNKYMKSIQKDLGVKCKYCHNMDDKSIDTPHKAITRDMIILTRQINEYLSSFKKDKEDTHASITCWTCHKGKTEVEQKRPIEE